MEIEFRKWRVCSDLILLMRDQVGQVIRNGE